MNTRTVTGKKTRKFTKAAGISIPIVMALIIAASIAIAVYFIATFMGLSFAVGGTPQFSAEFGQLSKSAFEVRIKNIGSASIKQIDLVIVNSTNKPVFNATFTLSKPIAQGQEAVITCDIADGTCNLTVSGGTGIRATPECGKYHGGYDGWCSSGKPKWPPDELIPGESYRVVVKVHFTNGPVRIATATLTAIP